MKNILFLIPLLTILSCKRIDVVTKEPSACIEGPILVEEFQTPTYTFCGEEADNFEWSVNGSGILGTGKTFVPTFVARGKYVIVLKAKNKKFEKTTSINVEYGRTPKTTCLITNLCHNGNPNISDLNEISFYWAYLYDSKSDWSKDVENRSHQLVKDSLQCQYSNSTKSAYVTFTKPYTIGTKKYISIEYRNPSKPNETKSNWAALFKESSGIVEIKYDAFNDQNISTVIDNYSKTILTGKWLLTEIDQFSTNLPLGCKADDYLKFNGDGTWKYHIGNDNCGGSAEVSYGTYNQIPTCDEISYMGRVITTLQGEFKSQSWTITFPGKMEIFTEGNIYANHTFTLVP